MWRRGWVYALVCVSTSVNGFGFTLGSREAKLHAMSVTVMRVWGIGVTAALMAGALWLSAWDPDRASAEQTPVIVLAQAPPAAQEVAFLVRFRGDGPIARSQSLAARGREAAARREIEAQLQRQEAFRGLCFDRFTVGAAEVVLRSCQPVPGGERAAYQERWLARLRAMRSVAYVDANATATQGRAPG